MLVTEAPEAEKAVLGAMMVEHLAARQVPLHLVAEDFWLETNRHIYKAALNLLDNHPNGGVDTITLAGELRRIGKLDAVGGIDYLTSCLGSVATAAHVDYYCKEVKKASLHRQISTQLKITNDERSSESLKRLHDLMYQLGATDGDEQFDFGKDLPEMLDIIATDKEAGIMTGFHTIDKLMMGFERGDVITIGGRTGLGKTALMVRMLCNMAQLAGEGENFLYMTAEMSVRSIVQRIIPMASKIPASKFKRKELTREDISKMVEVTGQWLAPLPIKMVCKPFISLDDIRGGIMKAKARVVFVDYLQRCRKPKAENMAYAIEAFMAELKTIGQATRCTIVLGVQLDRGLDRDRERPPCLADMKGSSAIEAESDGVILLWEPSFKYSSKKFGWMPAQTGCTAIDAIVAKGRSSKTGIAQLQLSKETVDFSDRVPPDHPTQESLDLAVDNDGNH